MRLGLARAAILVVSLVSAVRSAASVAAPPEPVSVSADAKQKALDPACPAGSTAGFEADTYRLDVPLAKVYNVVGSFFNASWYGTEVVATSGANNKPASKRTITYGSSSFNEVLTAYAYSKKQFIIQYMLEKGPVILSSPPSQSQFDAYTETLYFSSICGGKATYVSLEATYCGKPEKDLYEVYVEVHRDAVKVIKAQTGAKEFGGSCPI